VRHLQIFTLTHFFTPVHASPMCIIKQYFTPVNLSILNETKIFTLSQIASCLLGLHLLPQIIVGLHSQTATKITVSADGRPVRVPDVHFRLLFAHDKDHGDHVLQLGILLFYSFSMFSMYLLSTSISETSTISIFFFRSLLGICVGTIFFYIIAVLFGAPVLQLMTPTMTWSIIQSICVILPLAASRHFDINLWKRVYALNDPRTAFELCASWGGIGSTVGAWFGACLIPLDWDEPWQTWPITLIYGGSLGFIVGHISAFYRVRYLLRKDSNSVLHTTFLIPKTKV